MAQPFDYSPQAQGSPFQGAMQAIGRVFGSDAVYTALGKSDQVSVVGDIADQDTACGHDGTAEQFGDDALGLNHEVGGIGG